MKVHSELGPGFTEKVYQEALAIEFSERGIPFAREKEIDDVHRSQAINYAKIAGFCLSLLINFGESSLAKERFPIRQQSVKSVKSVV